MVTKKKYSNNAVLFFIESREGTETTRNDVAKHFGVDWPTAERTCKQLCRLGKVFGRKKPPQKLWRYYRHRWVVEEPAEIKPPFSSGEEFLAWCLDHLTQEGTLTPADRNICEQLMLGRTHAEIALVRGTTVGTVGQQVKFLRLKLGITSPSEMLWVISQRLDKRAS